jgi:predicted nucleic-acid-binding protein
MVGLDTNVLVRYIAQDDPKQSAQATRLIESLSAAEPGFVASVVLVEAVWVMEDIYAATRECLGEIVQALLEAEALVIQSAEQVWRALAAFRKGKADFADCLITRICAAEGCDVTWTFDKAAARDGGMKLIGTSASAR